MRSYLPFFIKHHKEDQNNKINNHNKIITILKFCSLVLEGIQCNATDFRTFAIFGHGISTLPSSATFLLAHTGIFQIDSTDHYQELGVSWLNSNQISRDSHSHVFHKFNMLTNYSKVICPYIVFEVGGKSDRDLLILINKSNVSCQMCCNFHQEKAAWINIYQIATLMMGLVHLQTQNWWSFHLTPAITIFFTQFYATRFFY